MSNVDMKLLRQTKFPPEFSQKVDMKMVNIEVMKKWIAGKISEILGSEDDVVIELCFNLLERERFPDIKRLQIQLTGFLDKDTARFCKELWNMCLSAQKSPQGVPKELLEAKKLELMQEKIDAEKASSNARQRTEQDRHKERDIANTRKRERAERNFKPSDRSNGSGRRWRDHKYDRNPRHQNEDSEQTDPPRVRETDTYVPRARERRGRYETVRRSSRSPYRRHRSGNDQISDHRARSSSSFDSRSQSPRPRNKKRDISKSATPP